MSSTPRPAQIETVQRELASRIRAIVVSELRPRVRDIDRDGIYPEDILRSLGQAGAFAQHHSGLEQNVTRDLGAAIEAIAIIAEDCLTTAFCAWCQDALGWYVENTENAELRRHLQQPVAYGQVLGGTGLSNPIKALSGIEKLRLRGQRVEAGWLVNGSLPWVSNLGEGHPFGICFAAKDEPHHLIMALARCGDQGIETRQNVNFIALEGSATMAVTFRDAFIPDAMVLADPAKPLIGRIRAGFVLLQTGMALGLVGSCMALMRESSSSSGVNTYLPNDADDLEGKLQELRGSIHDLARTPYETDLGYLRAVLQARLHGSELALAAAQSSMLHAGARGYIKNSTSSRRLREAHFIAIVTPAMKHLRKDLKVPE